MNTLFVTMELQDKNHEAPGKEETGNTGNDSESKKTETPKAAEEKTKAPRLHAKGRVSFMLDESKTEGGRAAFDDELPETEGVSNPQQTASTEGQRHSIVVERMPRIPPAVAFLQDNNTHQEMEEEHAANALPSPQHETTQTSRRLSARDSLQGLRLSRTLPEAMALLSATTKDLQGRVNLLLAQHEDDFFVAFRTHMTEVQKHIECLRESADAQKNLVARDLKVRTLENELRWFVEEALRLDHVRHLLL